VGETSKKPGQDAAPAEQELLPLGVLVAGYGLCAAVLVGAVVWAGVRLWPEKRYDTGTPMEAIRAAGQMLEDRRADRLVELIEAVPPDEAETERAARMEDLYIRLGRVLAAAQDLHSSIERAMPEEMERLAKDLEQAEAKGEATTIFGALMPSRGGRGGNQRGGPFGGGEDSPERREARERAFARLLADPFGPIDDAVTENIDRIGVAEVGADMVAITWDKRAVLPPFGLTMRQHPEGWRVVPPTSLPMLRRYMPDTDAEFQVWGSLLATLEVLLDDLRSGVDDGSIDNLQALSRRAIEDAIIPIGMVMVALGNADE
jgi:hypothetical protein